MKSIRLTRLAQVLARPGETLAEHSLRVVDRVGQLERLRPAHEYPRLYDRLRWSALILDSGKLALGFQRGLRVKSARWGLRHEVLSLAFLDWFDFETADRPWIIAAIATHHRDAEWILNRYRARPDPRDDLTVQLIAELDPALVRAWYDWLASHAQGQLVLRPFTMPGPEAIRAALTELEAWIAPLIQDRSTNPDFAEAVLLRGGMLIADHAASAQARPFVPAHMDRDRVNAAMRGAPYPHQRDCASSPDRDLLLIAPTGSGKTEAALTWAVDAPRLIYMLPYRASMNAMAARLKRFTPPDQVGLQHGRALQAVYRTLLDEGKAAQNATREAFDQMNLARLHGYPVRVFSPYHLLQAVYQFKGFEASLTDCFGARVIVDEIHAYQPERLAMLIESLVFLKRHLAARFLIMTATLPPLIADVLREALPDLALIQAGPELYAAFRRHRLCLESGDVVNALDAIVAAQQQGQAVLVTLNTVRRARYVANALMARGCPVLMIHGRFNARDRWQHEKRLLSIFGAETRPDRPAQLPIAVTTQVIEVSLDLDFDCLYTDPAPLEALIQRFGRVNRRGALPDLATVHVFTEPTGADEAHPIYDPDLVQASLSALRPGDGQPIDEAGIGAWLTTVYSGAIADAWQKRYATRREDFRRAVVDDLCPFRSADEGLARQFAMLFDGLEILPLDLEEDYQAALQTDPIAASELLVPIAYWQYKMLERQRRAWPDESEEGVYYTDAPYNPETGLQLSDEQETDP